MTVVEFFRLLRSNWKVLVIASLVGLALAGAYIVTRPVVYAASSTGMVVAGDSLSAAGAMSGTEVAQQRANAYLALLNTSSVAERTRVALEELGNPAAASGSVTGGIVPNTAFIRITATGTTAQTAQDLANATLTALADEALQVETYALSRNRELPRPELEALTSVHVLPYEPASLPAGPQRGDLPQTLLIGLGAGLLAGAGYAFVRHQFDVRVRTQAHIEEYTGSVVLGVVPESTDLRKQRKVGADATMGHAGEALRHIRTNLRFVHVDSPLRAVVITSPNPGEGKSTLATNLAQVIAKSGRDVVLVDCDLRRPMQATAFGVDTSVGLTQVLAGEMTLDQALIGTHVPGLTLLPAGPVPPNPSELLGSRRMQEVIDTLVKKAFVVLDAPPMLAVTDAGLLSESADGVILVCAVGSTTKAEIAQCAKQLTQVGASLLGTVLNKAPRKGLGEVLYGYGAGGYSSAAYSAYAEKGKKRKQGSATQPGERTIEVGAPRARRGAVSAGVASDES